MRSLKLPLLALTLLLTACGDDGSTQILGKWAMIDPSQPATIEFLPGGRYRAETIAGAQEGHWTLLEGNRLATWVDESRPKRVSQFEIHGDKLLIANENGPALVHQRVTEPRR